MKGFQIKTLPGLFCWPLAILLLAGPVGAQQPLAQAGGDLPVRAVRQIEALLAAKAQRTPAQRKVSSQFLEAQRTTAQRAVNSQPLDEQRTPTQRTMNSQLLDALRTPLREPTAAGTALLQATDPYAKDERVMVDIRADVTPAVLARIQSLGGTVVNSVPKYRAIRARLPLTALEPLATLEAVQFIRPADQPITDQVLQRSDVARAVVATSKVNTSEGDVAHQANSARQTYTVDGTGIGIGVISDGVETLADQQATGDVPGQVFVLPGQEGGSFDLACGGRSSGTEGTALFEIVHDLAPGADLFFATGGGGRAQMAQNIEDLCAAGADIIVDDIGYLGAAAFQDDVIAKAITAAAANGCFYFSSAGNAGNLNDGTSSVWEGDFVSGGMLSLNGINSGAVVHDFGGGVTGNRIKTNSTRPIILQWADPVDGSANDYDLFLIDADDNVLASSTSTQDGTQDPIEYIGGSCSNDREDNRLVIVKNSGAEDRYVRLNYARGGLEIATAGQTFGHSASKDAIGVAAVDVGDAGGAGGVFDGTESVETFSSDGLRRIFFEADGTPITAGNFLASTDGGRVLQKPDLAAADGVSTSTPGFSTFRGTSAAAPHAAAIAALMLEAAGGPANVTPAALRTAMTGAALDIEATGVDRDSGAGIVMAPGAVDAVDVAVADRNGAPTVSGTISDRTFAPGDAALTIDLTSVFSDPDNDTLTYTVWSSDNARLSVSAVTGTSFTLTPVSPGRMVVAVVAADPEGLIAVLTFGVTVTVGNRDYDSDDDGLIDVGNLAQLNAMRYDLNGDGSTDEPTNWSKYHLAFVEGSWDMGCLDGCIGYELTTNLDFDTDGDGDVDSSDDYWNSGHGWVPIPNFSSNVSRFATIFEGNGRTITNLFIDSSENNIGLFGATGSSAVIRNLEMVSVQVTGNDDVGGLVGSNGGAVSGSFTTGKVSGDDDVGGLVGANLSDGAVSASYSTVQVTGDDRIGGTAGLNNGEVRAAYATGRVVGGSLVGGLIGWNTGEVNISYATGLVSSRSAVGGLVGRNGGGGNITDSYWDSDTSGHTTGSNGQAKNSEELQLPTTASDIYLNWNVDLDGDGMNDDPWDFGTSGQYPVLSVDTNGAGGATWQEFGQQLRTSPALMTTTALGRVTLTWSEVSSAVYNFYRTSGTTVEILSENTSSRSYVDTDVTAGATYVYQVAAVINGSEASRSPQVSVVAPTPGMLPTVILQLMPTSISEDGGSSTVTARLSHTSGATTTVTVSATAVTPAVAGDFTLSANKTLMVEAGQATSTETVTITANNNDVDAPNKTVMVMGTATNSTGVTGPSDVTLTIRDDDATPVITTAALIPVAENETVIATLQATDEDDRTEDLEWDITGGNDRSQFTLTRGGELAFTAAKDYEEPDDSDRDRDYEVTVQVSDGANAVEADFTVRLQDVDDTAPTVSGIRISSNPGTDRTYAAEDEIRVTVTFSETVEVTGAPQLSLELGGGRRTATYEGGSGTAALVFAYEVAGGESDTDGVGVEADSLSGGTIRDGSNNNAVLDHDGLAADSGHKVDAVKPQLAATGGVVVDGATLTLTYGELLDGSSTLAAGDFTVSGGDSARTVSNAAVSGSAVALTLDPAVEHGETGVTVSYTPGTNPIRDVAGNEAEALSRVPVSNETPDTTAPEVIRLAISSNPGSDQAYAAEDVIEVTVTFSETVVVTGTPQLRLRVGSSNRTAAYLRGTDTEELVFGYEVADGHEDTDGVSIAAGRIALNGGTIEDEADNPAELAHEAVAAQVGHKVDGVRPVFVSAAVDGSSLTLTYGETLDGGSRPAPGDFTVEVDGAGRSVTGVSVSGRVVTLTLNPAVEHGDTGIRVSYTPGTNPIQDAVGNDTRGLSNQAVTNTTGAPNTAPEITTVGPFTVRENQALVRRLAARDNDSGDEVTGWSIVGGADQSQFSITSDTGDLSFQEAPDYESPTDVLSGDPPSGAGDNEYVVTVEVRSGAGARELEAEQTFTVRVTDEREPPGIPEAPAFSGETADSLTVRWSEPENTGPPIMDYDVRYREKGPGRFIDAQHMGPGLSLTLADLEPGTAYEVQVRATNDEGTSDWSDPGEGMTVTPLTVEMMGGTEPPVEGPFTVRFSFSEPVRGFTQAAIETAQDPACTDEQNNPVFCEPDIGRLETVDDRVFSTTVTPQTDRVAHNYTLTLTVSGGAVRSSVGNKLNEEAMLGGRVAPPGVTLPISEIDLRASGLDRAGRLNWNRPTNDGGSPIIRYEHRHAPVGEVWNDWENVGARATGVTVGNLVNGLEYVFEVRAVNALGKGPVAAAAAIPVLRTGPPPGGGGGGGGGPLQTVPDAPTNLLADATDEAVTLMWEAPEDDGGAAITDYEYRIDQTGEWISIGSTDTTHMVTGLVNGTAYVFQVRTVTAAGSSAPSNRVEATPRAAVTLLVANFSNGNSGAFNSRVYLWNPSTSAGQVTARVFTLPLTTGIARELTGPPLDLGTLEARSALNLKLVEDILDPLGIALPYTTDGGNLTLEFTIQAVDVRGVAQVFSSDFAFGTYPLQEIPSTSSGSPTVLVANFTNANNGALHSRVYLWNPSATDGRVTARVFTLPNTGDSMRLLTVPLGILKAFSARNIRIAEDILDFFSGIALPYTDDGGNLMLEFTIEAPDVKGAAQVFSSDFAFGTYPLQEIPSTPSGSPTVLVANFTNANNGALHSRVYLWNPSASAGEVTVRVFTLPRTGDSSLLGTLDLGSLQAESARNLKLAEDILAPLEIALPYVTDGGNLTLEFTIQAADARGVAQVFSSDFAFGTYPMQEIPSTSSGSPTVLVANFINGNDAALNSRVYLWNPSLSAGSVTVRVFTLPLTAGVAQELTSTPLDLGTLGAESARNLKLVEDILTPLGIPTPYVTDGGNLTLEFTIQAADVRGAAQVFSSSFAFGTVPLQVIR